VCSVSILVWTMCCSLHCIMTFVPWQASSPIVGIDADSLEAGFGPRNEDGGFCFPQPQALRMRISDQFQPTTKHPTNTVCCKHHKPRAVIKIECSSCVRSGESSSHNHDLMTPATRCGSSSGVYGWRLPVCQVDQQHHHSSIQCTNTLVVAKHTRILATALASPVARNSPCTSRATRTMIISETIDTNTAHC
jgi:hypothetical protein